jgi:hypothetical protein
LQCFQSSSFLSDLRYFPKGTLPTVPPGSPFFKDSSKVYSQEIVFDNIVLVVDQLRLLDSANQITVYIKKNGVKEKVETFILPKDAKAPVFAPLYDEIALITVWFIKAKDEEFTKIIYLKKYL